MLAKTNGVVSERKDRRLAADTVVIRGISPSCEGLHDSIVHQMPSDLLGADGVVIGCTLRTQAGPIVYSSFPNAQTVDSTLGDCSRGATFLLEHSPIRYKQAQVIGYIAKSV